MQQEEWLRNRRVPTEESIAEALAILDHSGTLPPDPGDEILGEADELLNRTRNRPVESGTEPQLTAR
jgi:hypothetical protein